MKLLLDEMYSGLKDYFEVMGWDVITTHEADLEGSDDRDIAEYAKKHNLLLITEDKKPAELASILGVKNFLVDTMTKAKMIEYMLLIKYPKIDKTKKP
jgi:predicted nuclease of predicted toxin-antitoxin system